MDTVIETPSVRARFVAGDDEGLIVVTFQNRTDNQALDLPGFGQAFLREHRIAALHLTCSRNHWWQTPDIWTVLDAAKPILGRFGRIATYGSSMGGYGALLFSGEVKADIVIALSPLYSIHPSRMPQERRWLRDLPLGLFDHDDMDRMAQRGARVFVFFDPWMADGTHAQRIASCFDAPTLIPMPFSGHPCAMVLQQSGILSQVILPLLNDPGTVDITALHRQIRQARRGSAFYWRALSGAALKRHPKLSLAAARQATTLFPNEPTCDTALALALSANGEAEEGVAVLEAVLRKRPGLLGAQMALVRVLMALDRVEAALVAADRAVLLAPTAPAPRLLRDRLAAMVDKRKGA